MGIKSSYNRTYEDWYEPSGSILKSWETISAAASDPGGGGPRWGWLAAKAMKANAKMSWELKLKQLFRVTYQFTMHPSTSEPKLNSNIFSEFFLDRNWTWIHFMNFFHDFLIWSKILLRFFVLLPLLGHVFQFNHILINF